MTAQIHRRSFVAALLSCPACIAAAAGPEWNYTSAGPARWASLDPKFAVCGTGDQQSPVDLRDGIKADLPPFRLNWKKEAFQLRNNGHTIQADVPAGSTLGIGSLEFTLLQFHFHSPSEHAIAGKRSAMEGHFVHRHSDDHLAVVAALIVPGGSNAAFSAIMQAAPAKSGATAAVSPPIDPRDLLPGNLAATWRYEGSLTTPPCSQIVDWIVCNETVAVPQNAIDRFRRIYPMNARPLQPLDRRYLLRS